jgi:hypothetical protein
LVWVVSRRQEGADVSERGGSTVPEPIPPPQGYERLEGLSELIRRIVREELRPIHLLLE